jgi:hypothetical protein
MPTVARVVSEGKTPRIPTPNHPSHRASRLAGTKLGITVSVFFIGRKQLRVSTLPCWRVEIFRSLRIGLVAKSRVWNELTDERTRGVSLVVLRGYVVAIPS